MKSSIKAILIAVCSVMMCTAAAGSRGKVTVRTMLACQGALTRDGAAEKALFPGGYASLQGGVAFHFYTSDYLGNVRAVTNGSTGAIEQAVAYYPYGGVIADLGTGHAFQPYKFGEKELVTANGLNEYDFGARRYYQAVPMFTSPDPSSEKYPWLSPYLYCAGDPVNAIDPDGMDIRLLGPDNQSITVKTTLISQEYDLSSLNLGWNGNMVFEGDNILSAALDLVGIFDPSGVADVTNAGLQFNNGEWLNGLISGAGVIPLFGDAFKVFKIPGFVKTFKDMSAGIRKNNRIGKAAETMVTEEIVKEFPGKTVVDQVPIRLQDGGHTVLDNLILNKKEVLLLNETKYGGAGLSPNQIRFYGGEPGVFVGKKAKELGIYGLPVQVTKDNKRITIVNPNNTH